MQKSISTCPKQIKSTVSLSRKFYGQLRRYVGPISNDDGICHNRVVEKSVWRNEGCVPWVTVFIEILGSADVRTNRHLTIPFVLIAFDQNLWKNTMIFICMRLTTKATKLALK